MIEKTFNQPMDSRMVSVKIDKEKDSIDFEFVKENFNQWFYDISLKEWVNDDHDWHNHMKRKRWFTKEMEDFIDKNSK